MEKRKNKSWLDQVLPHRRWVDPSRAFFSWEVMNREHAISMILTKINGMLQATFQFFILLLNKYQSSIMTIKQSLTLL